MQTTPGANSDKAAEPVGPRRPCLSRRNWVALLIIITAGLLLRIAYLREASQLPDFAAPVVDAEFHDSWARDIAGVERGPGGMEPPPPDQVYLRPPGYAFFLACVYKLCGPSYWSPRIVQMFLGIVNGLLVFQLARRWFGITAGLIAAALFLLHWPTIYFEVQLQEPVLLVTVCLCATYCLSLWVDADKLRYIAAAGLMFGLAAIIRPNVLTLLPPAAIWIMFSLRDRTKLGRRAVAAVVLGGAALLTILPVTIRNYVVANDRVLISANAGINLLMGNNPEATGLFNRKLRIVAGFGDCREYERIVSDLERKLKRELKYSEVSRHFADQAIHYAMNHPQHTAQLIGRKALLLCGPSEIPHNKIITYEFEQSPTLRLAPVSFPIVFALAIVGGTILILPNTRRQAECAFEDRERRQQRIIAALLSLLVLFYLVSFLPFFVTALYRIPTVPFLAILGAAAVTGIIGHFRQHNVKLATMQTGAILLICLIAHVPFVPWRQPSRQVWYMQRIVCWVRQNRLEKALRVCEDARQWDSTWPRLYEQEGCILARLDRPEEAKAKLRAALRLDPTLKQARACLRTLSEKTPPGR